MSVIDPTWATERGFDPSRLAGALASPRRVHTGDRQGWLDLFAADAVLQDPIDAGRYEGTEGIGTFWDVFIAPQRAIRLEVARDFWAPGRLVRQATVLTTNSASSEPLRVPALLRYDMRDGWIAALTTIWEPAPTIGWYLAQGPRGWGALAQHGFRMMRGAGLAKGVSFGRAMLGIGRRRGKRVVEALAKVDAPQWSAMLGGATISVGHADAFQSYRGDALGARDALRERAGDLARLRIEEVLTCGHHVGAFAVDPTSAGALALMLRLRRGEVDALTAIWTSTRSVLCEAVATARAG
ncbi:MAG: nuclear transport factor 2 family protein [Myxococcales bacterium]|nr:nuclear transport factor 2 family protein [Myxococcales bacterium]